MFIKYVALDTKLQRLIDHFSHLQLKLKIQYANIQMKIILGWFKYVDIEYLNNNNFGFFKKFT